MQSHRRLPHDYLDNRWLFVTWHLHGSLPHGLYPPHHKPNAGQTFVWMDRHLDRARTGPLYLNQEAVASIVAGALMQGIALGHFCLEAFVIMANHVHVLLLPLISPSRLLKAVKGASAREANLLLGRTGEPFWQKESYDHWVRDEREFARVAAYIEDNPVNAGLAARPEDYPRSSANERWCACMRSAHDRPSMAHTLVCAASRLVSTPDRLVDTSVDPAR